MSKHTPELLEASKRFLEISLNVRKFSDDDYEDAEYCLEQAIAKEEGEKS